MSIISKLLGLGEATEATQPQQQEPLPQMNIAGGQAINQRMNEQRQQSMAEMAPQQPVFPAGEVKYLHYIANNPAPVVTPLKISYANGRLPSSALKNTRFGPMYNNQEVSNAFNGLYFDMQSRPDTFPTVRTVGPYRTYAQQVEVKQNKGNLGATPGNSVHGLGLANDITTLNNINKEFADYWGVKPITNKKGEFVKYRDHTAYITSNQKKLYDEYVQKYKNGEVFYDPEVVLKPWLGRRHKKGQLTGDFANRFVILNSRVFKEMNDMANKRGLYNPFVDEVLNGQESKAESWHFEYPREGKPTKLSSKKKA